MQRALLLCFSVVALVAAFPFAGCTSSSTAAPSAAAPDGGASDGSTSDDGASAGPDAGIADAASTSSEADASDGGSLTDPVYSGSQTCASELANGWDPNEPPSSFSSQASYDAFVALNKCACVDSWGSGGCANICDQFQANSPNENFCQGVVMLANCRWCLQGVGNGAGPSNLCGDVYDACNAN
jgi:hypothetical protein